MKPAVTRIASVPMTALLCCPQCYRLISYEAGQTQVKCQSCGTALRNQDLPTALGSSLPD
jgi:LSD1 subclass zinc finger protein